MINILNHQTYKETNTQIIKIIKEKYNGNVDEYMDKEGKKAIKKQLLNVFINNYADELFQDS